MLTFGSCVHASAEYGNKYKLNKGRDAKLSVMQDVFHEEFKQRVKRTAWNKSEKPEKIESEGIKRVVPLYHEKIHKVIEPALVEEPCRIELPDDKLIVTGSIDLAETDDQIRDLKNKGRSPSWDEAIKSFQGKSYKSLFYSKFKKEPKGFVLDCTVRKQVPELVTTKNVPFSKKEDLEFKETCRQVVRGIRAGLFYPRREMNYFCSPNSCGYWDICAKGAWRDPGVFTKVFGSNESENDSGGED